MKMEVDILPKIVDFKPNQKSVVFAENLQSSEISLHAESKVTVIAFLTEGSENIAKIKINFLGAGAELLFLVFIIGTSKNKFLFETESLHTVPGTKAKYLVKCAMFDESFADYKGNLVIAKSAPMTEVYLGHHTLLLSPLAHAKTLPALEIEADEVKAGHAASLGKVDEELIFYCMTRGISPKEAERMLVDGFFADELALIEDKKLREELLEKILQNIPANY